MIISKNILASTPIAEGGEGIIYKLPKSKILKVYKIIQPDIEEKLKRLMSKNLPSNVVKPIDLAYQDNGKFIGFVMNMVEGEEIKYLENKKYLQAGDITIKDITAMMIHLRDTLTILHQQNIYISDLNDRNILIDKHKQIHIIDIDSWSVDEFKCTVCMDGYKDPLMQGNSFSKTTDFYAFAILLFKSMVRLHPFGGVVNPDMDIPDRMKKKISVIDNKNVIVPKTITKWDFLSPELIKKLKQIYESDDRFLIESELNTLYDNMSFCDKHKNHYYSNYSSCPICDSNAKIHTQPTKIQNVGGIAHRVLFEKDDVKFIISDKLYVTNRKGVTRVDGNIWESDFDPTYKYYLLDNGMLVKTSLESIYVGSLSTISKQYKSRIIVEGNSIYYVDTNLYLCRLDIINNNCAMKKLQKVSINNVFENKLDHYFICNSYDTMRIINVDGYNIESNIMDKMVNYGIHFDTITKRWLFIYETVKGDFVTRVYEKDKILFSDTSVKYSCNLSNLCFFNNAIYIPGDNKLIGYSYSKSAYKIFDFDFIDTESKVERCSSYFKIYFDNKIYQFG